MNTYVDIPIEIGLPHFIQDDRMDDDGPLYGNFKLSLQSVVCHRGNSVDSGHYIALVRSETQQTIGRHGDSNQWLRFDDLASQRVTHIDIERALTEETPYLLFYQILPIDGDPGNLMAGEAPPAYPADTSSSRPQTSNGSPPLTKIPTQDSSSNSAEPSSESGPPDDARGRRRPSVISFPELSQPRQSMEANRDELLQDRRKSVTSLGRTLSKLASRSRGGSKEDLPQQEVTPQIRIEEVPTRSSTSAAPAPSTIPAETDPSRSKSDVSAASGYRSRSGKRDRSRNRLMRAAAKSKGQDPDRECIVM